jgi:hypothetical protein
MVDEGYEQVKNDALGELLLKADEICHFPSGRQLDVLEIIAALELAGHKDLAAKIKSEAIRVKYSRR